MAALCVYCGSSSGHDPRHAKAAEDLADMMLRNGLDLVYGGGSIGLMGILSRKIFSGGGKVTGIIPDFLNDLEVGSDDVTEKLLVTNMHDRKRLMIERSDGFVALSGGIGTLDETAEALTWAQLKLHAKPIWFFGPGDYWRPLIRLFDHMTDQGFLQTGINDLYDIAESAEDLETQVRQKGLLS